MPAAQHSSGVSECAGADGHRKEAVRRRKAKKDRGFICAADSTLAAGKNARSLGAQTPSGRGTAISQYLPSESGPCTQQSSPLTTQMRQVMSLDGVAFWKPLGTL